MIFHLLPVVPFRCLLLYHVAPTPLLQLYLLALRVVLCRWGAEGSWGAVAQRCFCIGVMPPACVPNLEPTDVLPLAKSVRSKMNASCPAINVRTGKCKPHLNKKKGLFLFVHVLTQVSPACRNQTLKTCSSATSSYDATKDFKATRWLLFMQLHLFLYFCKNSPKISSQVTYSLLVPAEINSCL